MTSVGDDASGARPERERERLAIEASGVGYTYPLSGWTLEGIDVTLRYGRILALTGPNGSGKTTLIKLLATVKRPGAGSLRLLGGDAVRERWAVRRKIAYLPQQSALADALSVDDNLFLAASFHGFAPREARGRVGELVEIFGLETIRKRTVGELSGGQYRRVALARAFVGDPELLLLDEPTVGMDAASRDSFHRFLRELSRTGGVAIVLSSHDAVEVERLADARLCLEDGRAVEPPRRREVRHYFDERVIVRFFREVPAAAIDHFSREVPEVRRLGTHTLEFRLGRDRPLNEFLKVLGDASAIASIRSSTNGTRDDVQPEECEPCED